MANIAANSTLKQFIMRYTICLIAVVTLLLFAQYSVAQDKEEVLAKKISASVCSCLKEYRNLYNDSDLAHHCYELAFKQVEGVPTSQGKINKLIGKADGILQKDCLDYIDLLRNLNEQKGDWEKGDSTAVSKLDSVQCHSLLQHSKLYYLEYNGDTTMLTLSNDMWQDSFQHGRYYSKCKLRWLSGCEIEIEFQKSTEPGRSRMNKKGEKYYYRILDKTDKYYLLLSHYGVLWAQFKIYYE